MSDAAIVLAIAGSALSALVGLLAGLHYGLRVSTTDSANLARFAVAAEDAGKKAADALVRMQQIEEANQGTLEELERKRRKLAATASRAERAEKEEEAAVPPAPLTQADRRRAVAAQLRARRAG